MEITVKSKYLKISPRKVRPVLAAVKGAGIEKMLETLPFMHKEAARLVFDLVKSGLAAAKENDIDASQLLVKNLYCNEGPSLKRRRFAARGRVNRYSKKMSHLVLTVSNDISKNQKSKIKDQNDKVKTDKLITKDERVV